MNTHIRKFRAAILLFGIAFCVMFGSMQHSKAAGAFYRNYYSLYQHYLHLYQSTGVAQYYYDALAFLYYYDAGYYADYYGYHDDPVGFKSEYYRGSTTYAAYYYETFTADGDYYARL